MRRMRRTSVYLLFTVIYVVASLGVLLVPGVSSMQLEIVYIFLPLSVLCVLFVILSACIDLYKGYTNTASPSKASLTYSALQVLTLVKPKDVSKELFDKIIERCEEREQRVKSLERHRKKFERWIAHK